MKKLFPALACLALLAFAAAAQKGRAEPDYYPSGYPGDTWVGEVVAVDNVARTLTLKNVKGKEEQTFVATLPDAPYQWAKNGRGERVLDFPYDKQLASQLYKYEGWGEGVGSILPDSGTPTAAESANSTGVRRVPNPPDANRVDDLSDFKGRRVVVYYTARERKDGAAVVKYNDVWRVRVMPKK